ATVAHVAIQDLVTRAYRRNLALGLLAPGGTLGILIPPSIPLIVYGVITEESIGKLFLAGIGPGLLLIVLFGIYTVYYAWKTKLYRLEKVTDKREKWAVTLRATPTVLLAVWVIGGVYTGAFTPTEASAVGAVASLLLKAVMLRTLSLSDVLDA